MKVQTFTLAASFATALATSAMVSATAVAASSGTLALSGVVPLVNSIAVTANGTNNSTLNITGGVSALNVATAVEQSNDAAGYKINMSSANGGHLQLSTDATKYVSYQISYDGLSYVAPTTVASKIKTVNSLSALTSHTSAVLINVTGNANALAGIILTL